MLNALPSAILPAERFRRSGSIHTSLLSDSIVDFKNMATTVKEICPSEETLTQKESEACIPCPTQECSRVFQNRSCLRMHLVRTHGVAANTDEKNLYVRGQSKNAVVEKHFYCPVKHCVRGQGTQRPFPRMSQLKQVTSHIRSYLI